MGILWEHHGEVQLPATVTDRQIRDLILPHIAEQLEVTHLVHHVEVTGSRIRFATRFLRFMTWWHLLKWVAEGTIEAATSEGARVLRHHLRFRKLFFWLAAMVMLPFVVFWTCVVVGYERAAEPCSWFPLLFLAVPLSCGWLISRNITHSRFRAFIERGVQEALADASRAEGVAPVRQDPSQSPSPDS
jgi:hypothetical protein